MLLQAMKQLKMGLSEFQALRRDKLPDLKPRMFGSCALVANGENLLAGNRGADIDGHDTIFRHNTPVKGYEKVCGQSKFCLACRCPDTSFPWIADAGTFGNCPRVFVSRNRHSKAEPWDVTWAEPRLLAAAQLTFRLQLCTGRGLSKEQHHVGQSQIHAPAQVSRKRSRANVRLAAGDRQSSKELFLQVRPLGLFVDVSSSPIPSHADVSARLLGQAEHTT